MPIEVVSQAHQTAIPTRASMQKERTIPAVYQSRAARTDTGRASTVTPATPRGKTHAFRWAVIVSTLVGLLLVLGSTAYAALGSGRIPSVPVAASSAAITITPMSTDLQNTYPITAVTGTPDPTQHQVQARWLPPVQTQSQSLEVHTTGTGTTSGTQATGTLLLDNFSDTPLTLNAGLVMSNEGDKTGTPAGQPTPIDIMLDATVTIPAGNGSTVTAPSHVVQVGTIGNIPLSRADGSPAFLYCQSPCLTGQNWAASNQTPFTGGQDAKHYPVVQQSDIDGAKNTLLSEYSPDPQQTVQGQIRANEQLIGSPTCNPNVTSDHGAGDKATKVTVTVFFTCTGEAYDHQGALSLALALLKQDATRNPGTDYALVGSIVTTVVQAQVSDQSQGTVAVSVRAEGVWVFQFNDEQKQALARLLAGKKKGAAQVLLSDQPGVNHDSLVISGGDGVTLPTNPSQINIVVLSVQGTSS